MAPACSLLESFHQTLEAAPEHVVIVLTPGVARDPGEIAIIQAGRIWLGAVVELADADDGLGRRQQVAGIVAHGGTAVREVAHFTRVACANPLMVIGCLFERGRGRHTGEFEAALASKPLDDI